MSFSDSQDDNPLQCPLCLLGYDTMKHEAKLLTCHHSFCLTCVHQMADGRTTIKCPTCRRKTPVPAKGVRGLQSNFYISQMWEVMAKPKPAMGEITTEHCHKHSGQPLLFFCETCSDPICMNCTVLDHEKAAGHVINDLAKVIDGFKEVISGKVTKIEAAVERRRTKLQSLKTELSCLDIARDVAEEQVQETFTQIKGKLNQRQAKLVEKLNDVHEDRKSRIIKQAHLLKSETKRLNEALTQVHNLTEQGGMASVATAAIGTKGISDLDSLCLNVDMGSPIMGHIQFKYEKGLKNFVEAVNHLGEIQSLNSLPAIISVIIKPATAGLVSELQASVRNDQNEAMPSKDISIGIVDQEGDQIKAQIQVGKNDVMTAQFRPQLYGEHQVIFRFLMRPLGVATKSFSVECNNPVQIIGAPGSGAGQLNRPTSVAISPKGHIYVADMGNKRIQMFNTNGNSIGQFKVGSAKTTTYDLTINKMTSEVLCTKVTPDPTSGHMLADIVRVFGLSGEKKHQFSLAGATNALFLAVNKQGNLVTTDRATHSVRVYNADGTQLLSFGSYGTAAACFNFPSAICLGSNEEIIVSDTHNHRVQVFDKAGKHLRCFGSEGKGKGQFQSPRGIAADAQGHVLVADSCNRIQVFRIDGTYLSSIESESDPINEPYNMEVTQDGHVFLADFKSCCIKKYKYI